MAFLLPVSIFQILPDCVLAELLGTLRLPVIGGPRIDRVINLAMGGMWVAPLFITSPRAWGPRWPSRAAPSASPRPSARP